jgi:hypothetical protein
MKINFNVKADNPVTVVCTLGFVLAFGAGLAEGQEFIDRSQDSNPGAITLTEKEDAINELSGQLQERAAEKLMNDAIARVQTQNNGYIGVGNADFMVKSNRNIAQIQRQRAVRSMEVVEGAGVPLELTSPMRLLTQTNKIDGNDDLNDSRSSNTQCRILGFC